MKFKFWFFILILLLLPMMASSTIRMVCLSGCTYSTPNAAVTAAVAGDTIRLSGANATDETPATWLLSASLDFGSKANCRIESESVPQDTIERNQATALTYGTNLHVNNLYIRYTTDNSVASFTYLVTGIDKTGATFRNCTFFLNGQHSGGSYKRGPQIRRTGTGVTTRGASFINCKFDQLSLNSQNSPTIFNGIVVDSCIFLNAGISIGNYGVVRNSTFRGGNEVLSIQGDSITIENNYLNAQNGGIEYITSDHSSLTSAGRPNITIRNNIIDSSNHVPMMLDGLRNSQVYDNTCIYRATGGAWSFCTYLHDNGNQDSADGLQIFNNTSTGAGFLNIQGNQGWQGPNQGISVFRNIIMGSGGLNLNKSATDSVYDNAFLAANPTISPTPDYLSGNSLSSTINFITSVTSEKPYLFLKYRSPEANTPHPSSDIYWGSKKHLLNPRTVSEITTEGFSVVDSLSELFWYDLPVGKDTIATTILQTSQDGSSWTNHTSISNRRAGQVDTFIATGLSPGIDYQYRLIAIGNERTGLVTDTTIQSIENPYMGVVTILGQECIPDTVVTVVSDTVIFKIINTNNITTIICSADTTKDTVNILDTVIVDSGTSNELIDGSTLALFEFNEGIGNTTIDLKNNIVGSMNNVTWTENGTGFATTFNGINSFIKTNSSQYFSIRDTFTIDIIFRIPVATEERRFLFGMRHPESLSAEITVDGKLGVNIHGSGMPTILTGINRIDDGNWHSISIVNVRPTSYLYIDGVLEDQISNPSLQLNNISDILIGHLHLNEFQKRFFFQGDIDLIRFSNTIRTEEEIISIFNRANEN